MRASLLAVFGMSSLVLAGWLTAAQAGDDAAEEMKKLNGTYLMVSGEASGEKISDADVKASTLTLKGTKYTVKLGDKMFSGIQKIAPGKTPKQIDATDSDGPNKGKTILGIYKLEKNVLTVYFAPAGKDRPTAFAAKTGPGEILHVWKRK